MEKRGMHNLTTLIKRLEAITSRLEDIVSSTSPPSSITHSTNNFALNKQLVECLAQADPLTCFDIPNEATSRPLPESVEAFDAFIQDVVGNYCDLSRQVGGAVSEQAAAIMKGFMEQRRFLLVASRARNPATDGSDKGVHQELIKPIKDTIASIQAIQQGNRGTPSFNLLTSVADGALVLAWVLVENRPWKHVEESLSSAQYFGNKILKEEADKGSLQVRWVGSFYLIFRELTEFLRQYLPYGIVWNPQGELIQNVVSSEEVAHVY